MANKKKEKKDDENIVEEKTPEEKKVEEKTPDGKKVDDKKKKKWIIFIFASLSFFAMLCFIVAANWGYITAPCALAIVAILSYHTTLSLDNYGKDDAVLNNSVMRNAITATIIVMYIVYFSFALNRSFGDEVDTYTENLTKLTMVIAGFYFGSDVISDLIDKWPLKH